MPASAAPKAPYPWPIDFFILAAIWGSSFLFMRLASPEFGPIATAALRVGIAALVLLPVAMLREQTGIMLQHWKAILAVGFFNAGLPFVCFSFAVMHISTGMTSMLNATMPMFTALVAWVWLGMRPGVWRMLGLLIGFGGVGLLVATKSPATTPSGEVGLMQWLAIGACLVATLCYGVAASLSKKYLSHVPALATSAGSNFGAALLLLVPALWTHPATMPGQTAWLAITAAGVMCTGLAYILYYRMIQTTGPAITSTVTYLVPVFALAYGYLFLKEQITLAMGLSGAVILLGTALSTLAPAPQPAAPLQPAQNV
ncbi:MAG: DMT family transporter [Brachymonas sp.]|nr:DMT family transporter [Brachymonas sp.]